MIRVNPDHPLPEPHTSERTDTWWWTLTLAGFLAATLVLGLALAVLIHWVVGFLAALLWIIVSLTVLTKSAGAR